MTQNLELCWCLEFLGLDQSATVEETNQSYAYLFQMIHLMHSTVQDPDQDKKRKDKLTKLDYAYKKVIDHIHSQSCMEALVEKGARHKEPPQLWKASTDLLVAFEDAKQQKARADASYSAALTELQKAIKLKRDADLRWIEALGNWNAQKLDGPTLCGSDATGIGRISQPWLDTERRRHRRFSFLCGHNPTLTIDGKQFLVTDISREGIRFRCGPALVCDKIIRGRLDLQGVSSMHIVAKVIRILEDEAAAKLITRVADILISNLPGQKTIHPSTAGQ